MPEQPLKKGRPRSERARDAVLEAADDLLVEVGYAALTMKGIAERARVGRQTVYRWWSSKAEILYEASATDIEEELELPPTGNTMDDLVAYITALGEFLANAPAGIAWRALLAAAQHDPDVATLLSTHDPLTAGARSLLRRTADSDTPSEDVEQAAARLVGPVLFWILTGNDPRHFDAHALAARMVR